MVRLSYSAVEKYKFCPALYKYHYIDRLRPIKVGSPLAFGSALDEAFGRLKLEKKKKLTKKEKELMKITPEEVFCNNFVTFSYNNKKVNLAHDLNLVYSKSDIDLSLLNESDKQKLLEFDDEVTDYETFIDECFAILKAKKELDKLDHTLYNYIAYLCMYRKGLMLVEAYRSDIMPKIHEVFEVQKQVELKDEDGNIIIGYIDAIVSFVDNPDQKVVLDDKTSSKPYKLDSVATSPQLATYCEFEGTTYGAYAVAEKAIRKRNPRTRTQLIIDEVLEETFDKTFEEYDNVLEGIKNEEFAKNYDSGCFNFGKVCDYYGYCRSNCKNKKGLVKLKR